LNWLALLEFISRGAKMKSLKVQASWEFIAVCASYRLTHKLKTMSQRSLDPILHELALLEFISRGAKMKSLKVQASWEFIAVCASYRLTHKLKTMSQRSLDPILHEYCS
jgi:vacuolar-type H+-ATPase catalytic subunit A/Vma1